MTAEASPRVEATRRAGRARVITLARIKLPTWNGALSELTAELRGDAGLSDGALRTLFPTDRDLLRAEDDELLEEIAHRVRAAAERFDPAQHTDEELPHALAVALADARPLDWSSLNIRLRVRLLAASTGAHSEEVLASERAFLPTMLEAFELLLSRIHHRFTWSPALGVRVVILTYERSFESWIMSGRNEQSFAESSYIKHTLPELLLGMSAPTQQG
jgi:hypothetical protein